MTTCFNFNLNFKQLKLHPRAMEYKMNPEAPQPPDWEESLDAAIRVFAPYHKITVSPNTNEYAIIRDLMPQSTPISKIERVVNTELWKKFTTTRRELLCSKTADLKLCESLGMSDKEIEYVAHVSGNSGMNTTISPYLDNVALLWHGTRGNLDAVLSQGLDERLGNAGSLGKGIYFADDPNKSMGYDSHGVLILFAVFLGDCLNLERGGLVREPEKSQGQKRNVNDLFFDSIVGRPPQNEYVIYNRFQCCPMYAVSYQRAGQYSVGTMRGVSSKANATQSFLHARASLPPFAWKNTAPDFKLSKKWPFYAETIFNRMRNQSNHAYEESASEGGEKISKLWDMGFYDIDHNRELLKQFGNNLERTIEHLLVSAGPSSLGDSRPSNFKPIASSKSTSDYNALMQMFGNLKSSGSQNLSGGSQSTTATGAGAAKPSPRAGGDECFICHEKCSNPHLPSWRILQCNHKVCQSCFPSVPSTRMTMAGQTHTYFKCPDCGWRRLENVRQDV